MVGDSELLARYVRDRSQRAFGELVARHLDLVYASARRQLGNAALAEDVTQAVFLMLATRAPNLRADVILPAWLMTAAWYACKNAMRQERRRRIHEMGAALTRHETRDDTPEELLSSDPQIGRLLDEGLRSLREADRAAVVMHYLQGRTYEQVAAALDTTPDAARKRTERAILKLRARFASAAGAASLTPAAVTSAFLAAATVDAPVTLLAKVSSSVVGAPAGAVATIADGSLRAMTIARAKLACAAALAITICVAGVVAAAVAVTHRHNAAVTAQAVRTTLVPATAPAVAAAPLDALRRLAAAVRDGDGDAAKSLAAVTNPADQAFIDLAAENIRLAGLFKSAYRDAFGAGAANALPRDWYPTDIADARVRITGDRATIVLTEGTVPMVNVDGQWKVPSSFVTVENQGNWPSSSPQALQLVRLNNLAYAEATQAIALGRFKSPEQARADLRERLARAKAAAAIASRGGSAGPVQ